MFFCLLFEIYTACVQTAMIRLNLCECILRVIEYKLRSLQEMKWAENIKYFKFRVLNTQSISSTYLLQNICCKNKYADLVPAFI